MTYVTYRLADLAMDLIVEHLVKKYRLTEATAIYGPGQLAHKLQHLSTGFRLYVVAHGACDLPVMMRKARGEATRFDRLGPKEFATELYNALPHGEVVQVKLAMCDGATEHSVTATREGMAPEKITSSFASLTALVLDELSRTDPRHLDVSKVFIGGALGAAYWDKDGQGQNAPRFKRVEGAQLASLGVAPVVTYEKKSRAYFSPVVWQGKMRVDLSRHIDLERRDWPTYCYFPFMFELKKPLTARAAAP